MRILFLQENGYYESIGVMYISAFLKKSGHIVDLYIASEEKNLFQKIRHFSPDLIALSCTTDMHQWVIGIAQKCKRLFKAPVIVGGPHPTCFPEIIKNRGIDMICQGEGEYSLLEYANRFDSGGILTNIPGIWVKTKHKMYRNPPGNLIADFSNFPIPDRDLYYKYSFIKNIPMKRFITGRGCPFHCAFCHNQLLKKIFSGKGVYVRKMPVRKIIHEILEVQKNYPLTAIHFSDDTFVLHREWVYEFCKVYKQKIHIPFSCNVRVDLLNEDLIKTLHDAGCRAVAFGVESGNEHIRNMVLHKNIPNDVYMRVAKLLHKYHIKFLANNMIGVPGETKHDVDDTVEFNRVIKADFTRCFIFDAFPGLPLTYEAIRLKILPKNYSLKQFTAMTHRPIIHTVSHTIVRNVSSLFSFLVYRYLPYTLTKVFVHLPYTQVTYTIGRIQQAYTEMKFFRIPLLPGLRYSWHTLRSFHSN